MQRILPILVATALVLVAGGIQGIMISRWTTDHSLERAAARLDHVAMTIGDWKGQTVEQNTKDLARAGIVGGLLRRYVNHRNGAVVTLLIVCGPPGPISVHTPEVCYAGAGYDVLGPRVRCSVAPGSKGTPAEFWKIRLRKQRTIAPEYLGIHYAWSAAGDWQAPDGDARLTFAGSPSLYKMYVVRQFTSADEPQEADPSLELIGALLPELRKSLFPPS
jgi:hypothetical protein